MKKLKAYQDAKKALLKSMGCLDDFDRIIDETGAVWASQPNGHLIYGDSIRELITGDSYSKQTNERHDGDGLTLFSFYVDPSNCAIILSSDKEIK